MEDNGGQAPAPGPGAVLRPAQEGPGAVLRPSQEQEERSPRLRHRGGMIPERDDEDRHSSCSTAGAVTQAQPPGGPTSAEGGRAVGAEPPSSPAASAELVAPTTKRAESPPAPVLKLTRYVLHPKQSKY